MGQIHQDVYTNYLSIYPDNEEIIRPFLNGFDITFATERNYNNTDLTFFFFKPELYIEESYGISREIMAVYSPYDHMESRTIQAVESFLKKPPALNRIESINFILISEANDVDKWVEQFISQNKESRIIIPFSTSSLKESRGNNYFVRKVLSKHLYGRDLFDYRLPLENDNYFFGRKDIVASIFQSIEKSENFGLFGLRKTGKTSILFKLERQLKNQGKHLIFYYDCKNPSIRSLRWYKLMEKICLDIETKCSIKVPSQFDEYNAGDLFTKFVEQTSQKGKIIIIFDEIEYISPIAKMNPHWKTDFINFWQVFWATQSRNRCICAIIVGVNPYPLEIDTIDGIQNPLFGIVPYQFLRGLTCEDMKLMIKTLGKKMGLKFDHSMYKIIYEQFGGHPLLTRIACSSLNKIIIQEKEEKPIMITPEKFMRYAEFLEDHLIFYYRHVVSELKEFYEFEYELLEFLASGQKQEFLLKSKHPEYIKHLKDYGLINNDTDETPRISIPVIGKYIGYEYMRREGRKTIYKLVDIDKRPLWINNIKYSIITDLRFLESLIKNKHEISLFGPNSFPEADEFCRLDVVTNKSLYIDFLNVCNRCFVESIENYGKSISKKDYFWNDIKLKYPALWESLYRIKLYRHAYMHRELKEKPSEDFLKIVNTDLEGQSPGSIENINFLIQQCILEGFLTSIQIETSKISS